MATLDEVKRVIARITRCGEDEVVPDLQLKDVKADSLHWVQIIVGVENALDVEIDVDRMREFTTICDFVEYLDSCVN